MTGPAFGHLPPNTGSGREGKRGCNFHVPRVSLCTRIWQRLDRTGYIIIRAPPQSGKTYILDELADIHKDTIRVVYISLSGKGDIFDIDELIRQECGGRTLEQLLIARASILILIDEAQKLYHLTNSNSRDFWEAIKTLEKGGFSVRVVMAAAYGYAISGFVDQSARPTGTPPGIGERDVIVSIAAPTIDSDITLLISYEDYGVLWKSFRNFSGLPDSILIKDFIWSLCGPQVALLSMCLNYILTLRNDEKAPNVIERNAIMKLTSVDFIAHCKATVRSLLGYSTVTSNAEAQAVLRQLLWVPSIPQNSVSDEALKVLVFAGHVYLNADYRVCFSSPLHRAWFMHELHTRPSTSPSMDIKQALFDTICRWDPEQLKETYTRTRDGRIKESCFQMEMFRSGLSYFPTRISAEVGEALDMEGCVDFFVPPPCAMAFEFTRDGSKLKEHLGRFINPDGKYKRLIESGLVTQWVVVDVRSPRAAQGRGAALPTRVLHENLYTVLLNDNYSRADVYHQGQVIQQLVLVGKVDDATRDALIAALRQSQGGAADA